MVAGIAPLAIASLMTMQPALAQKAPTGSWTVGPYGGDLPAACLMSHVDQSVGRLFVFIDEDGVTRGGFRSGQLDLPAHGLPNIVLRLNGSPEAVPELTVLDRTTVLIQGDDMGVGLTLVQQVLAARTVEIRVAGVSATYQLSGADAALSALRGCMESGGMEDVAMADEAAAGIASSVEDELETEGLDLAMPADGSPQASAADEAAKLRQALGELTGRAPMFAQFQCQMSGSEMMGIPDINGVDSFESVGLSIAEDGSLLLNGTTLPSVYMDVATDGSGMPARAVFDARKVIGAIQSTPSGRAPLVNMTPDEQRAWDFVMGTYVPGMTDLVMGDKARYMMVDLDANTVGFFDLDAGNQPVNQSTSSCLRTG